MDAPTDDQLPHVLRIADTSDMDDGDDAPAPVDDDFLRTTSSAVPADELTTNSSRTPAKHRGRRSGTTQRLSAVDMAAEIARVDKLNSTGRPTIAQGTERDRPIL